MSRPNLYALPIKGGKQRIFSVAQVVAEADITKRAARRLIKRAVKNNEVKRLRRRNGRGGTMVPEETESK